MAVLPIPTKSCTVCREVKPFEAFGKDRTRRYGLSSRCRPCHATHVKAWAAKQDPAYRRSISSAFKARNPDKAKEYDRTFYYRNIEQRHAKSRDHYIRTRDKRLAQAARWKEANPDRCHEHWATRRGLMYGTKIERISFKAIVARDNGKCWMCGIEPKGSLLHFDHVIPLSKGGTHTFENIRVSCAPCNRRKGARIYPVAA